MSDSVGWLCLRLEGPIQSWGFESQYNRRATGLMPTKSAIAGICCAAYGFHRGSEEESAFLRDFGRMRMLAIAVPRRVKEKELAMRRFLDYHTVQGTRKAEGGIKDCHITRREYVSDASFGAVICGKVAFLEGLAKALADPVWGIWLGRKTCIPTAPVLVGLFDSQDEALRALVGESPIASFTRQEEVESFGDGLDSIPDRAICFDRDRREFAPRRIRTLQGE